MNISFENPDKINGLLTVTVEEADYKEDVEKTLKDYRKKANVPGFRPGQVPMGMIKRQFEPSVKMDTINKLVGQKLYEYIRENNIPMLGEPLASDKQDTENLEEYQPVISFIPGWKQDISACRRWEELPDAAKNYIKTLEKLLDHEIQFISVGAKREEYLIKGEWL